MVFNKLIKNIPVSSRSIFLGAPEAEAESLATSQMSLAETYEDYHNILSSFKYEKFILIGRKGSGKSAFAEYVSILSKDESNLFSKFVKHSDSNLERIVQLGKDAGHTIENEQIFKWLILTNLLKLFTENQAISNNRNYTHLIKFLKINSGFIEINEREFAEQLSKDGINIELDAFKKFFRLKHNRNLEIRQTKAPFYKLLPHLEEVILKTLSSEEEKANDNSYILFFDDLDIDFDASNEMSVNSLVNLVRMAKYVNNDLFGKHNINSKVIILLRDDIEKLLASKTADAAKLFSSYSTKINWFPDDITDEMSWHLRHFINKRIKIEFSRKNIKLDSSDPWKNLVDESSRQNSSFRHILNYTLYRPRDLILFFKPLQTGNFKIPLNGDDIYSLVGQYSESLALEIKNELSSFYSSVQIETIFNALNEISNKSGCSYSDACAIINEFCDGISAELLLEDLFERSFVGNKIGTRIKFKYREPLNKAELLKISKENDVIVHNCFKVYFSNKYN